MANDENKNSKAPQQPAQESKPNLPRPGSAPLETRRGTFDNRPVIRESFEKSSQTRSDPPTRPSGPPKKSR